MSYTVFRAVTEGAPPPPVGNRKLLLT